MPRCWKAGNRQAPWIPRISAWAPPLCLHMCIPVFSQCKLWINRKQTWVVNPLHFGSLIQTTSLLSIFHIFQPMISLMSGKRIHQKKNKKVKKTGHLRGDPHLTPRARDEVRVELRHLRTGPRSVLWVPQGGDVFGCFPGKKWVEEHCWEKNTFSCFSSTIWVAKAPKPGWNRTQWWSSTGE